jgi:ribosomal protein S6--L-glutamate ligase
MKILILTGSPSSYSVRRIKEEAEKRGHEVSVKYPSDFICYVSDIKSGHDRIYLKDGNEETTKVNAKEYDVVIPRFAGASVFEYGCIVTEHLSGNMKIPTTSNSFGLRIASNKFLSSQALSQGKVRTIRSLFSSKPVDFGFIAKTLDGPPIVCKTTNGSQGAGVFILSDELGISTTLGAFSKSGINLVLQKYLDSGEPKTDIRAYVIDGKVSAAYKRFALNSDFRSNYSLSKHGEKAKLTEEETQMAIEAAKSVGLGVCAVDIIRDSKDDEKPYCIEINGNGNLAGIEKVTEVNVALDIVLYAEKIGKNNKGLPDKPGAPAQDKSNTAASAAPKEDKRTFWEVLSSLRAEKGL